MNKTFEKILRFINKIVLTDLSVYDESFLLKTIQNRINHLQLKNEIDYLHFIEKHYEETVLLIGSLRNCYTEFFRNPFIFGILEQIILPKLFEELDRRKKSEIRIWSAGCSSGQEAYSIAILVNEFKMLRNKQNPVMIFATDISETEIQIAKKGQYDQNSIRNIRYSYIDEYFIKKGKYLIFKDDIKKNIDFSIYDLLENDSNSPPASIYGDFDLILCNNLLFYYNDETKHKIIEKLYKSLNINGYLFTGEAEADILCRFNDFQQISWNSPVFRKK